MTDIQKSDIELSETGVVESTEKTEQEHAFEKVEEVAAETEPQALPDGETAESEAAADTDESKKNHLPYHSREEVIARLKEIVGSGEEVSRQESEALKSLYYRLLKQESEAAYNAYAEAGGLPEEYMPAADTLEPEFKELMNVVKEKRAALLQEQERERNENYEKKLSIIERIKAILSNPDEINRSYNEFKELQQAWNEIKNVPAEKATELWKTYQVNVEQFYDTLKLNNELRAYDFKKNLELKEALCAAAEKLAEETDVVSAFRKLQQLHQEFREIGPVERDLRESVWNRFKAASTAINKKHQEFFEQRKEKEQENLDQKTAICEIIEGIDIDALTSNADWNKVTEQLDALREKWKGIGFAPQKMNVKIYERFRAACDAIYKKRTEFYKSIRETLNGNLRLKRELCEQAEALKDSTAWKETAEKLVALQKKWKEIGPVPRKHSEELWKRFNVACDAFFESKKSADSEQNSEQKENLAKKKSIIERLAAIDPATVEGDLRTLLRKAQEEWNAIGHVPFKEKDSVYKKLREQMDRLYGAANASASHRRVANFKSSLGDADSKVKDKLLRQFDILKNEIKTYENNLGFLSLSSKTKSGSGLIEELNRKVEKLKADLEEVKLKLEALEEKK